MPFSNKQILTLHSYFSIEQLNLLSKSSSTLQSFFLFFPFSFVLLAAEGGLISAQSTCAVSFILLKLNAAAMVEKRPHSSEIKEEQTSKTQNAMFYLSSYGRTFYSLPRALTLPQLGSTGQYDLRSPIRIKILGQGEGV